MFKKVLILLKKQKKTENIRESVNCYQKWEVTNLKDNKCFDIIVKDGDVMPFLREGQLITADLERDSTIFPWDDCYYANSIQLFNFDQLFNLRNEFVITWISKPYFDPEENEELGYRMRKDVILAIPQELVDQEFACSIFDEDVLIPLKENDVIEASLFFQAYEDYGSLHQTIYATNIKKVSELVIHGSRK